MLHLGCRGRWFEPSLRYKGHGGRPELLKGLNMSKPIVPPNGVCGVIGNTIPLQGIVQSSSLSFSTCSFVMVLIIEYFSTQIGKAATLRMW